MKLIELSIEIKIFGAIIIFLTSLISFYFIYKKKNYKKINELSYFKKIGVYLNIAYAPFSLAVGIALLII